MIGPDGRFRQTLSTPGPCELALGRPFSWRRSIRTLSPPPTTSRENRIAERPLDEGTTRAFARRSSPEETAMPRHWSRADGEKSETGFVSRRNRRLRRHRSRRRSGGSALVSVFPRRATIKAPRRRWGISGSGGSDALPLSYEPSRSRRGSNPRPSDYEGAASCATIVKRIHSSFVALSNDRALTPPTPCRQRPAGARSPARPVARRRRARAAASGRRGRRRPFPRTASWAS
jgi:hypothetical protein